MLAKYVQKLLVYNRCYIGEEFIDGIVGPDTVAAIILFQTNINKSVPDSVDVIEVDGIAGPETQEWLEKAPGKEQTQFCGGPFKDNTKP